MPPAPATYSWRATLSGPNRSHRDEPAGCPQRPRSALLRPCVVASAGCSDAAVSDWYHRTASASSCSTPSPVSYMTQRLNWARALAGVTASRKTAATPISIQRVFNGRLRQAGKGAVRRAPPCIVSRVGFPRAHKNSVDAPIGLNRECQRVDRINHGVSISICFVRNPSEMILGSIGPQPDGKGSAHIRVEIQHKDPFLSGPGHDRGRTGRRE